MEPITGVNGARSTWASIPEGRLMLVIQEPRRELTAAAALIAIEHADALRAAAQVGTMNSAAGLLRLQYEAVLRAAWLLFAAGPGQIEKLSKTLDLEAEQGAKNMPGYLDMLTAVEKAAPASLAAPLAEFNRYSRHALNSFVHTGIHPLTRARSGFPVNRPESPRIFWTHLNLKPDAQSERPGAVMNILKASIPTPHAQGTEQRHQAAPPHQLSKSGGSKFFLR